MAFVASLCSMPSCLTPLRLVQIDMGSIRVWWLESRNTACNSMLSSSPLNSFRELTISKDGLSQHSHQPNNRNRGYLGRTAVSHTIELLFNAGRKACGNDADQHQSVPQLPIPKTTAESANAKTLCLEDRPVVHERQEVRSCADLYALCMSRAVPNWCLLGNRDALFTSELTQSGEYKRFYS